MTDNAAPKTPAEALSAIAAAWGKPTAMRSAPTTAGAGSGLHLTYDPAPSEGVEARLQALGGQIQISTKAPSRRNGPDTNQMIAGTFGPGVRFYCKATGIEGPTCAINIHLYPSTAQPGSGLDPTQLFVIADAVFGGEDEALALLPAYVSHALMRVDPARRFALSADLSQVLTDTLRDAANAA